MKLKLITLFHSVNIAKKSETDLLKKFEVVKTVLFPIA